MNSHVHTFTTNVLNNNILCPRCLSYIAIEDVESHSNLHERTNSFNAMFSISDEIFPRVQEALASRARNRTFMNGPLSRLARLQSLYSLTLGETLFNHHRHSNTTDSEDFEGPIFLPIQPNDVQYEFNLYIADLLGSVDVGVSDINKVSQLLDESSKDHVTCDCHICLEPIVKPRKLNCNHVYCDNCITTWLSKNKTCPVCRKDLEELEALKDEEKIED